MSPFIFVPFAVGTAAFFAGLAVTLIQSRGALAGAEGAPSLKKWDSALSWLMWGGWGVAMVMRFFDRNGFLASLTG
ncbi:MAG: hypothetical protein ISQ02_05900 [Pseudomonadales bacterium]|nr:hypothetical protein [Pseudomonadales bacterium]